MRSRASSLASLALFALVGMTTACGATGRTPKSAVQAYAKALQAGDVDAAYELMSAEFRAQYSRAEFGRMIRDNRDEAKDTAERLLEETPDIEPNAEFEYGLGERMRLEKEGGRWRIASNPLAFYSQKTPEDAVRAFVRAYTLKRWDVMLRLIPKDYRERMNVEMVKEQFEGPRKEAITDMMETLANNLDAPSSNMLKGNLARLRYGDSLEVELVKEEGAWKIKDL